MDAEREAHWRESWKGAGLERARRVPGREKFYALVAYPGSSGFLHVGHMRGVTLADALHRYHRMRGRQVFFPTGVHATGLPAVTFAQKVQRREPVTVQALRDNGVPEARWPELEDPATAARFLGTTYLEHFARLGILVDPSAYLTTIDPDYQAFIRWQFRRLERAGRLVKGPHFAAVCPVCGPVSVDPSETDLSRGGEAEKITYSTVPFALPDGRVLLAATLRPETVYGATNLWVPATAPLVVWHHGGRAYLVSRAGAERLVVQHGGTIGHEVPAAELEGRSAKAPLTGKELPLIPSRLVDPSVGSGVVMSVPAHAPADWVALSALGEAERRRIGPIPEIVGFPEPSGWTPSERELMAGEGPPAERAARATGARGLGDSAALDSATERLYRFEYGRGRMTVYPLTGLPVPAAREKVAAELRAAGSSFDIHAFSEPVICRNGHEVEIHRIPDQWFLRYGAADWKEKTHALAKRMVIRPAEYAEEFPAIVDWFEDRACTRKGRWLGTPFPPDPSWLIEPIADSTFYPAYFIVRRYVSGGRLPETALTDAFFDAVFLGEGDGGPGTDPSLVREVREEFLYWYPLDANIGGKEHKRVHFPVFAYTHAELLPPELQPRSILVHWWLTGPGGEKISKKDVASKGGRIPSLGDALGRWGADAIRLFHGFAASPFQDVEWDPELVDTAAERLKEVERTIREALQDGGGGPPELEAWLSSEMHRLLREAHVAIEGFEMREYAQLAYVTAPACLRRFLHRGGNPGPMLRRAAEAALRLLAPLTPFLAEELGEKRFPTLVAEAPFPEADDFEVSEAAVAAEACLATLEEDLGKIVRLAEQRGERVDGVALFVAAGWKSRVDAWVREAPPGKGPPLKPVMDRAKGEPSLAAHLSEIPPYVNRFADEIRNGGPLPPGFRELDFWRRCEGFLARRFRFGQVAVYPEEEAAEADPAGRRGRARPGRPAFYLVGSRGRG